MARSSRRTDIRIGHDARAVATDTLDEALREGRLDLAEYERRLVVVQAAQVRKDLTPAVADLPARGGQAGPGLRISTADRERALVRLADALTDGRIEAGAYADAEERLHRAVVHADVAAVVGDLGTRAGLAERDQAVARIEAAVARGLLDPAERHDRVAAVRRATTDAQLAALVADLPAGAGAALSLRASNADREAVAAQLHDAVEAGLLDLGEFDERVRAVYAARLRDELARLVADLPEPAAPPAPPPSAPPADVPRRKPSVRAGTVARIGVFGGVGTFVAMGVVVGLGAADLTSLAILVGSVWLVVFVALAVWVSRAATAELAEEGTPPLADLDRPVERSDRRHLQGHEGCVTSLAGLVLPDGTPVAISGARDNTARVWDLTDNSLRYTLSGHTHDVLGVAAIVLPDGAPVAVTVSGDRTARVWDLRDGSLRGTLPGLASDPRSVRCVVLADGTPVAVVRNLLVTIQVWDLRNHEPRGNFTTDSFIDAMAPMVLPDGSPVALVGEGGLITVVNLKNGKTRSQLLGHTDSVESIDTAVLPDGTPVAVSVSTDKTVRIWDPRRGELLHTIAGMIGRRESVVCTSLPDGTPIAAACDLHENTMVWDLRDGSELPHRLDLAGIVITAVALPDRTLILTPADDCEAIEVQALT